MEDRRRSLRWGGSLACRLSCGGESLTGQVSDLSFEGARVEVVANLPPKGSEILLTLRPERENVTLKAKVIYAERSQLGVQFCGIRSENLEVLRPFFSP